MAKHRELSNIDSSLVSELASRFGFDADALESEIKEIQTALFVEDMKADNIPTAKERKDELDSLVEHAENLRFVMMTMPGETRKQLAVELDSRTNQNGEPGKAFYDFVSSLDVLSEAIEAVSNMPVARKENPARQSQDFAINAISALWIKLSGHEPTFTTDWYDSKRGGDFVEFLTAIGAMLGFDPEPLPERFVRLKRKPPNS